MAETFRDLVAKHQRRRQDHISEDSICDLGGALAEVEADPAINDVPLSERLLRRVGLGENPAKRRAFFRRVCELHRKFPELLEELIAEAWAQSVGVQRRERYFCSALAGKLRDRSQELGAKLGGSNDVI